MDNNKKLNLIITALKQSLASKVAEYEEELATIRAEASLIIDNQSERISELERMADSAGEVNDVDIPPTT